MRGVNPGLHVGAWQFAGSPDIAKNLAAILRGVKRASRCGVRLLALQECALTGYAGVDIASPRLIDRGRLASALAALRAEARRRSMYLSLGTTSFAGAAAANSLVLIGPEGRARGQYHKRAMYEMDSEHYAVGKRAGIHRVDGMRVGLRICFEFRFPEYFRELLAARAALAVMGFSMVGPTPAKFELARAMLRTRAAENGLWILAANSTSRAQNAPTCLVDPDGRVVAEAPRDREALITGAVEPLPPSALRASVLGQARSLCTAAGRRGLRNQGK